MSIESEDEEEDESDDGDDDKDSELIFHGFEIENI